MLAKQKYADGGIISPANDSWEYKKEGDNYLTRKKTGDGKWITAKGNPLEHIKAKIYKETDAISRIKARPEVSSGTQSQKTGAVQTPSEKKEEKIKSSQLLRTGHGGWQQTAQEFLLDKGEYLGGTGPRRNGVDGDWGPTSQAALDNYKKRVNPMALPLVTKNAYGKEECHKWGCSKLASAKASGFLNLIKGNNTASTWAENAWFNKSHQLNEGGELIYNEPKRGDMGYVPKELYGILQVGDYVHLNRAGPKYDKEVHKNPSIRNEKVEHMGMIIGKDKNGIPLVYHGSESGKAYIQPLNKALTLPDQGRFGYKYWVSSIVRPKDLIGADFSNLKESKYHRPAIDVDKKDQLVALPGSSGYQRDAMNIINQNYQALAHMGGHTQDEINMAGEVLLGGILNMESKAMNTEYIGEVPIIGVDIPHPLNNRYSYGAFVKGKEILASAYKHPVFEGLITDEPRIEVFGKSIPAPGIGEASKSPYQFKPKMHFGTNARPTVLGESLYQNFNILPENANDNQKNQTIASMAILLNNMSSIKRRDKYDSKTDTYDGVPLPYILAKSWQGGSGFVSKEKYQDLIDDLDITYSNVALKEGREDITSGKGSTIDQAIFDTIEEKETARVEEAVRKINKEIIKRTLNLEREYNEYFSMPSESTDVDISRLNYKHGGPHDARPARADSEFYRLYSHAKGFGRHKKPISSYGQYVKNDYTQSTSNVSIQDNPDDWTYFKDFDPQNLGTNIMNPPSDYNASKYPVKTNVEGRLYPDVSKDYPVVPTSTEDGKVHPSNIKRFAVNPFLRNIDQGVHMQTGTPGEGGVMGEYEGEKPLDLPNSLFGRRRMLKKDLTTYFYSDPSNTKRQARKAAGKMIRKEVMPVYRQVKKDGGSGKNLPNPSWMEFYQDGGPKFPKDRKYDTTQAAKDSMNNYLGELGAWEKDKKYYGTNRGIENLEYDQLPYAKGFDKWTETDEKNKYGEVQAGDIGRLGYHDVMYDADRGRKGDQGSHIPISLLIYEKPKGVAIKQPEKVPEKVPEVKKEVKFDPEGSEYDMKSALAAGIKPDETGHWQSRDPKTGLILKGTGHETYHKTVKGEEDAGYVITKGKDGRYYSHPKKGSIQYRGNKPSGSQYIKYINNLGDTQFMTKSLYDTEKKYKKSNVLPDMKKGGRVCKLSDFI